MKKVTRIITLPDALVDFLDCVFESEELKEIFIDHTIRQELGYRRTLIERALAIAEIDVERALGYDLLKSEYFLKGLFTQAKPFDDDFRDCFDDERGYFEHKINFLVEQYGDQEIWNKIRK